MAISSNCTSPYVGPTCSQTYADAIGGLYWPLVAIYGVVASVLLLVSSVALFKELQGGGRGSNYVRKTICLCCVVIAITDVVRTVDIGAFRGVYSFGFHLVITRVGTSCLYSMGVELICAWFIIAMSVYSDKMKTYKIVSHLTIWIVVLSLSIAQVSANPSYIFETILLFSSAFFLLIMSVCLGVYGLKVVLILRRNMKKLGNISKRDSTVNFRQTQTQNSLHKALSGVELPEMDGSTSTQPTPEGAPPLIHRRVSIVLEEEELPTESNTRSRATLASDVSSNSDRTLKPPSGFGGLAKVSEVFSEKSEIHVTIESEYSDHPAAQRSLTCPVENPTTCSESTNAPEFITHSTVASNSAPDVSHCSETSGHSDSESLVSESHTTLTKGTGKSHSHESIHLSKLELKLVRRENLNRPQSSASTPCSSERVSHCSEVKSSNEPSHGGESRSWYATHILDAARHLAHALSPAPRKREETKKKVDIVDHHSAPSLLRILSNSNGSLTKFDGVRRFSHGSLEAGRRESNRSELVWELDSQDQDQTVYSHDARDVGSMVHIRDVALPMPIYCEPEISAGDGSFVFSPSTWTEEGHQSTILRSQQCPTETANTFSSTASRNGSSSTITGSEDALQRKGSVRSQNGGLHSHYRPSQARLGPRLSTIDRFRTGKDIAGMRKQAVRKNLQCFLITLFICALLTLGWLLYLATQALKRRQYSVDDIGDNIPDTPLNLFQEQLSGYIRMMAGFVAITFALRSRL
eukprot:Colp12_sorted_trinity150504_noHs@22028